MAADRPQSDDLRRGGNADRLRDRHPRLCARPARRLRASTLTDRAILEAYAVAEDRQHHETPRLPFPSMMAPMYREMAEVLGLPDSNSDAEEFRLSIPHWPAFADSVAALKRLKRRFHLVAMTNSDNWALSHFAKTLDQPFDDLVTAEMVGWNKPDPQVFAFTRGRLSTRRASPSPTSCTWRRASTTTSRWPAGSATTPAGSSAARASRARAPRPRCRRWRSRIITSAAWSNWRMRWIREVSRYLPIDFFPTTG